MEPVGRIEMPWATDCGLQANGCGANAVAATARGVWWDLRNHVLGQSLQRARPYMRALLQGEIQQEVLLWRPQRGFNCLFFCFPC